MIPHAEFLEEFFKFRFFSYFRPLFFVDYENFTEFITDGYVPAINVLLFIMLLFQPLV